MRTNATKEYRRSQARPTDPPRQNAAGNVVGSAGHIERPEESHARGPVPQNVRQYANAVSFPIKLWMPSWAHGHVGCEHPDGHPSPQPHQQRSGLGRQELGPLEPKLRQGPALERLPQPPKHWNLSLIGDSNSPPQDRIRQPVIFILAARRCQTYPSIFHMLYQSEGLSDI